MLRDSIDMREALVIIVAYVLGSIPFGYLIVRFSKGTDIRESGSGGTGATNVSRRAGKLAGVVTLLFDAAKGAAAVLIAQRLLRGGVGFETLFHWLVGAAAIAVIAGHMFPLWLRFRGGKGVATGVGVFAVLAPLALAVAAIIFALIVWRARYVSLGSIVATAIIPSAFLLFNYSHQDSRFWPTLVTATVAAMLIVFAHRQNIGRLATGTENKFK